MNERIKELAEQAGFNLHNDPIDGHNNTHEIKKFAQLIVRECASELIRWKDEPFPYDPEFSAKLIKKHFGVEP